MASKKLKIASEDEIMHELTKIALGTREFKIRDKGAEELTVVPPSEGAVMKALELLGKSLQLFSERQDLSEELRVRVSVIEPNNKAEY